MYRLGSLCPYSQTRQPPAAKACGYARSIRDFPFAARQNGHGGLFDNLQGWNHAPDAEKGGGSKIPTVEWEKNTDTLWTTLMACIPRPYPLTPGSDHQPSVCWPAGGRCHLIIRGGQAQPPHPASYIMSYLTSTSCPQNQAGIVDGWLPRRGPRRPVGGHKAPGRVNGEWVERRRRRSWGKRSGHPGLSRPAVRRNSPRGLLQFRKNKAGHLLESLHLLLHGAAQARVGEAHRVGDVGRELRFLGDELGQACGELQRRLDGAKRR